MSEKITKMVRSLNLFIHKIMLLKKFREKQLKRKNELLLALSNKHYE